MNISILKFEFRRHLRSVWNWALASAALLFVFFAFFNTLSEQAALMNEVLAQFPEELLRAFGMSELNFASVLGYFSLVYLFIQLFLAIQAGNIGFGLVSVEESELTADFLLTKPVSRRVVLTSKLLAALAALLLTNLLVWMASWGAVMLFRAQQSFELGKLVLLFLALPLFQLFFLGVGLLVSLLVKRVRSVTPYSLGLAFGAFVLNAFGSVVGDVSLEQLTPFKHFDAGAIVQRGGLDAKLVLPNLAFSLLCIAVSYVLYLRRDIHAVS